MKSATVKPFFLHQHRRYRSRNEICFELNQFAQELKRYVQDSEQHSQYSKVKEEWTEGGQATVSMKEKMKHLLRTRLISRDASPTIESTSAMPSQTASTDSLPRECTHCGATSTCTWRRGPADNVLCNGCGLRYAKAKTLVRSMRIPFILN